MNTAFASLCETRGKRVAQRTFLQQNTTTTCCNLSCALQYASFFGFDVAPVAKCKMQNAKRKTQSDILIDEYINTRFNQKTKKTTKKKQTKNRSKKHKQKKNQRFVNAKEKKNS